MLQGIENTLTKIEGENRDRFSPFLLFHIDIFWIFTKIPSIIGPIERNEDLL